MTQPPPSPPRPPDDDRTTLRPGAPQGPAATTGAPRRRTPVRLVVVLAAAVLAVILGVVGGTFVAGGRTPVGPQASPTPTPSPTDTDPASAVRGFLEAVARGDSAAALAYAETQPADTSFMSDAVLAAAAQTNPITEINVPPVPSSQTDSVSVEASYKIGGERVTESYDVTLVGTRYLLEEVGSSIDLSSQRSEQVPMIVAGRTVDADTLLLLPGAYEVTSGLTYITWGTDNTIFVKAPKAFLTGSALDLTINEAGTAAFLTATKKSLDACVTVKKVKPTGCPFAYTSTSYTINPKTITWALTEDPLADKVPRLDYDDDGLGTLSVSLRLRFKAKGKSSYDDKTVNVDTPVYGSGTATADLTGDSVTIAWKS